MLDVRERDAYEAGHIPGARLLPRGQLELRVNQELPDPTRRILTYCELGLISTLAAATLRRDGLSARGGAGWRHEGLARGGLSGQVGKRAVNTQTQCCRIGGGVEIEDASKHESSRRTPVCAEVLCGHHPQCYNVTHSSCGWSH